jgi:hypothetical protein
MEAKRAYQKERRLKDVETFKVRDAAKYQRVKARLTIKRRQNGLDVKRKCVEHLGGKCSECGYDNMFALTFHHVDGSTKSFEISSKIANQWSFERLKPEMDKCILLCANCHIIKHSAKWLFFNGSAEQQKQAAIEE